VRKICWRKDSLASLRWGVDRLNALETVIFETPKRAAMSAMVT
jgi:hypothetical protein